MSLRSEEIEKLLKDGAAALLARASNTHSLTAGEMLPRVAGAVDKYLLRNDENASVQSISDFVTELQADDLCLIVACEKGDESAWSDLVNRFTATVRSAARSASSNEDAAEDLAQSIWAELYGLRTRKDGKSSSKLAYYSGRGSLAGWLRAVVGQLAIDSHRKQARLVQPDQDVDLDRLVQDMPSNPIQAALVSNATNPEQAMSRKVAESDMQEALNRTISELPAEDRLLVRLYYFDNLRLREAGAVLGVHEATASRRLTRIHNELRQRVGEILVKERGWTKSETEESFANAAQHLDGDLEKLVRHEGIS